MEEKKQTNLAVYLLCIIIFLFTLFNVFLVELEKYEINKISEESGSIAAELQAKLDAKKEAIAAKNKESAEIADFTETYKEIRKKFNQQINILNSTKKDNPSSMDKYVSLVKERIKAAEDYKESINLIFIPEVLTNFAIIENTFIDSDIELWNEVLSYYRLADITGYDINIINEMAEKSKNIRLASEKELISIYKTHELEYFLSQLPGINY